MILRGVYIFRRKGAVFWLLDPLIVIKYRTLYSTSVFGGLSVTHDVLELRFDFLLQQQKPYCIPLPFSSHCCMAKVEYGKGDDERTRHVLILVIWDI